MCQQASSLAVCHLKKQEDVPSSLKNIGITFQHTYWIGGLFDMLIFTITYHLYSLNWES